MAEIFYVILAVAVEPKYSTRFFEFSSIDRKIWIDHGL